MKTRAQEYLITAIEDVQHVLTQNDKDLANAYGGLCHKIPMLVRNDGLMQAVAWIEEKAAPTPESENASALKRAYALQRAHISAALRVDPPDGQSPSPLVTEVARVDNARYCDMTLSLLSAWVYYKRFAASMLGVDSAEGLDEEGAS